MSPPNSVPDLIIQRSELGGESIQPRETLSIYANVPRRGAPGKPGETPFSGARPARHPSPLGGAAGERRRAPLRPPPASLTVAALVLAQPVLAAQEVEGRVEVPVDLVHAVADGLERHPPVGALRRLRAARRPRAQPGAAQQRQQRQRGAGHAERRPAEPRRLPAPAAPRPPRRRHRPAGSAPARPSQGAEPAAARRWEDGRAFPRPQVPGEASHNAAARLPRSRSGRFNGRGAAGRSGSRCPVFRERLLQTRPQTNRGAAAAGVCARGCWQITQKPRTFCFGIPWFDECVRSCERGIAKRSRDSNSSTGRAERYIVNILFVLLIVWFWFYF